MSEPISTTNLITPRASKLRRDVLLCYLLLCLHQFIWHCWLSPPLKVSPLIPLTFAIIPLVPGLIAFALKYRYALIWAGIAVLWHFIWGTMFVAIGSKEWLPALLQSVICAVFFWIWYKLVKVEKAARQYFADQ